MQENTGLFDSNNKLSVRDLLAKYLAYYPLFIISLAICIGVSYYYIHVTPPKYKATTTLLIRGNRELATSQNDLIESALNGKRQINLNNEILLITADNLMQRVVASHSFNISYFLRGKVINTEVYEKAPFQLIVLTLKDSSKPVFFSVQEVNERGGKISYGQEGGQELLAFKWNMPFNIEGNDFMLAPKTEINSQDVYNLQWLPVAKEAEILSAAFSATAFDNKTNVLQLTLMTENKNRGKAILNAICKEFNLADIEERNKLSENTVRFIDERLNIISNELSGVEGNLENYKGSRSLQDIKSQSTFSFDNSNNISNAIKELNMQQGIVAMIRDYFNNPSNPGKLVPSSMGLEDATLASLITKYNELQLRIDRESPLVGPSNLTIVDLKNQADNLKNSILESLTNISRNFKLQESRLQSNNTQYRNFLASLPHNERVLQEIQRKQTITEGLYLYLLQKREEAAISSTSSSLSHYKQIDEAKGFGPIEPNSKNTYLYATLLGVFLPFGFIYLRDLLNDKVSGRDDIVRKVSAPILGDVNHVSKGRGRLIAPNDPALIGEQFRIIRTNLSLLFKNKDKKVILITSTTGGEGKSFVSINLATVLAMPGKRVALLELDLRRPGIGRMLNKVFEKGISDYLISEFDDLHELYYIKDDIPSLHIYPAGPVLSNSADVLVQDRLHKMFSELRMYYDYIIVDSPPVSLVSDAFLLANHSDIVAYVVRQRFTLIKQLDFINEIYSSYKMKNVCLIFNDVKTGGRYGYNGYGYGNNYKYYPDGSMNGRKRFSWKSKKREININNW